MKTVNQLLDMAFQIPAERRSLKMRKLIGNLRKLKLVGPKGGLTKVENTGLIEKAIANEKIKAAAASQPEHAVLYN